MLKRPRFYRSPLNKSIGWEYWNRKDFLINISIGTFELQLTRWPKRTKE